MPSQPQLATVYTSHPILAVSLTLPRLCVPRPHAPTLQQKLYRPNSLKNFRLGRSSVPPDRFPVHQAFPHEKSCPR